MTVFKVYLKIIQKNLGLILIGTFALLVFCLINLLSDKTMNYVDIKPAVAINDLDHSEISKHLVNYFDKNAELKNYPDSKEELNDAIFNDAISYAIIISPGFGEDILSGNTPEVEVKTPGNYDSYLIETLLNRYVGLALSYSPRDTLGKVDDFLTTLDAALSQTVDTKINSKIDASTLDKSAAYFNYLSYSLIYTIVFIIGTISLAFNRELISRRTAISPIGRKEINQKLLKYNFLVSVVVWLFYILLGFAFFGEVIFTINGLLMILNSLLFTIFATVLGSLISKCFSDPVAINPINQIVSLGTSFLCGVFLPLKMLPDIVVKFAHLLPTYYYVDINNKLATMSEFSLGHLTPILVNAAIFSSFIMVAILINNLLAKRKR